jgi:putative hydrolase of the HAD superfamily
MENNYLQSIKRFLEEPAALEPVPAGLEPRIYRDPGIRAFIFDIYGTLLISASGDIDETELSESAVRTALEAAGIRMERPVSDHPAMLRNLLDAFRSAVKAFHAREKKADLPFPEIDILAVWDRILCDRRAVGELAFTDPPCIKCFTFVFETLSNRISPMPGMHRVLKELHLAGYPLGIISNAQFYTPLIMNYFLHQSLSESETVAPFDADLTLFSYIHRRSKPDPALFTALTEQASQKFGILPGEMVYVGNDMYRDVYPARLAGMKTALFAGDLKSLRLRKDRPELNGLQPDFVITDLVQLLTLVSR